MKSFEVIVIAEVTQNGELTGLMEVPAFTAWAGTVAAKETLVPCSAVALVSGIRSGDGLTFKTSTVIAEKNFDLTEDVQYTVSTTEKTKNEGTWGSGNSGGTLVLRPVERSSRRTDLPSIGQATMLRGHLKTVEGSIVDHELVITDRTGAFVLGRLQSQEDDRLLIGRIVDAKKIHFFAYAPNDTDKSPPIAIDLSENKLGDFSGLWTGAAGESGFAHFEPSSAPKFSLP